jgi:hypothetical protein
MLERQYFTAPAQAYSPASTPRCTVRALVFEKTRLAQSCN